jgi:hypothetical protein
LLKLKKKMKYAYPKLTLFKIWGIIAKVMKLKIKGCKWSFSNSKQWIIDCKKWKGWGVGGMMDVYFQTPKNKYANDKK